MLHACGLALPQCRFILTEEPGNAACSFTFHGQLLPFDFKEEQMRELEEELQNPTGVSTVKPPQLALHAVLTSAECGILYHIRYAEGLRYGSF